MLHPSYLCLTRCRLYHHHPVLLFELQYDCCTHDLKSLNALLVTVLHIGNLVQTLTKQNLLDRQIHIIVVERSFQ